VNSDRVLVQNDQDSIGIKKGNRVNMKKSLHRRLFCLALLAFFATYGIAGRWHDEVRLSFVAGQSWSPRLAAYNGAIHAVWFEYPDFVDPEIFYSRSLDNGETWGVPVNLTQNPSRKDQFPSISADGNGIYVFWSSDVLNGEVYFRRSADGGSTWGDEQQLTNSSGYSRASDVFVDSQGYIHLVWYDLRNGYSGIYHRQSCDHGVTWTSEQWVTQFDGVVDNEDPQMAEASDGTLYLLFRSSRDGEPQGGWPPYDMYLLRSRNSGCPVGTTWLNPAERVTYGFPGENSNNYNGSIAQGGGGRIHIAYWDEKAGNQVYYRRGVPRGSGWGSPVQISFFSFRHPEPEPSNRVNPGLTEDEAGSVRIFFSEHAEIEDSLATGRLFYRTSLDTGVTWNPQFRLGTGSKTVSPQAISHNGRVHVIWTDFRDNHYGSEIYYRYLDVQEVSLVDHYYTSILNRSPDSGGKEYWETEVERTTSLGIDLKEAYMVMSGNFYTGMEYLGKGRTNTEYLNDLYLTYFNRPPEPGGLNYWLNELASGSERAMVMYFFMFSPEFNSFMTGRYGDTATRAENYAVVDFYRGILNRLPDDDGFGYWLNRFRTAQCTGPIAVTNEAESISGYFFSSPEYGGRGHNHMQYVQDLYYTFMRRYATASEVNYWVNELNSGAKTREQLRQFFIQSTEFQGRVTAIINQGCL
jgi:hypothetical protein